MNEGTSFWQRRRVFITGATGFVGSWVVKDLLERGADVVALVRSPDPQSEFYRSGDYLKTSVVIGSLTEYETLERIVNEHESELIIHLAAQAIVSVAHRSPLPTLQANIEGTYNLLEVARIHGSLVKGVVVGSSDKAYGEHADLPYREDMALQGKHPYEVSKSCADLITQTYYHTYGVPAVIARCGNIYGGGDLNWTRIVPETIQAYLNKKRPVLRSDGSFVRDYIYVKDVSRAYLRLCECVATEGITGEAFNFSPERAVSVLELVSIIQRLMGCMDIEPDVRSVAQGEIHSQFLDSDKAHRLLKWTPEFSLEGGLLETIRWYAQYLGIEFSQNAGAHTSA